jgi:carbon-monoxide dehydrogenase medium subunit
VRHHQLLESPAVAAQAPILAEAAALVGNVRVRSLGTVGGSLAHADPAAELPMVAVALDGRLSARSVRGERSVSAFEFFKGYLTTALDEDEMLVGIEVDALPGAGYAVEELSRRAGDFAIVAVAAVLAIDRRGRVDGVRLAFAGVGPTPARARAAEDALQGHEPTAERIAQASRVARDGVRPESDAFVSAAYRRHLAGVLARRALARAVDRAMLPARARGPVPAGRPARDDRATPAGAPTSATPTPRSPSPAAVSYPAAVLQPLRLTLNGRPRELPALPAQTLLQALRDTLGVFDAKEGCGEGVCGACTVLLDGRPVSSCLVLAAGARGRAVITVRGIEAEVGLHPLQEAFVRHGAVQCGFCTPGILLTALAFLDRTPAPSREEIRGAIEGNLCRCTGYTKIVDAIAAYVQERNGS